MYICIYVYTYTCACLCSGRAFSWPERCLRPTWLQTVCWTFVFAGWRGTNSMSLCEPMEEFQGIVVLVVVPWSPLVFVLLPQKRQEMKDWRRRFSRCSFTYLEFTPGSPGDGALDCNFACGSIRWWACFAQEGKKKLWWSPIKPDAADQQGPSLALRSCCWCCCSCWTVACCLWVLGFLALGLPSFSPHL